MKTAKYKKIVDGIKAYLKGDLSHSDMIKLLRVEDYSEIDRYIRRENICLFVTKETVIKLLYRFIKNEIRIEQLAVWGSFIFYSYMPALIGGPLTPLNIEKKWHDTNYEDEVAEVIMKLEWYGDRIDGDFTKEDAKKAIKLLSSKK